MLEAAPSHLRWCHHMHCDRMETSGFCPETSLWNMLLRQSIHFSGLSAHPLDDDILTWSRRLQLTWVMCHSISHTTSSLESFQSQTQLLTTPSRKLWRHTLLYTVFVAVVYFLLKFHPGIYYVLSIFSHPIPFRCESFVSLNNFTSDFLHFTYTYITV